MTLRFGLKESVICKICSVLDLEEWLFPYTIELSIFDNIGDSDMVEHIRRVGVTFYDKSDVAPALEATQ